MPPDLGWARAFCGRYRGALWGFFVLEVLSMVFGLAFIWQSKIAVDLATRSEFVDMASQIAILCASLLLSFLCTLWAGRINEVTRAKMLIELQGMVTRSQMHAEMDHAMSLSSGDLMVRSGTDAQETAQLLGTTWVSTVLTFLRLLAALAVLGWLDQDLALLLLLLCPLVLFSKSYFRRLRRLNGSIKEAEGKLGGILQENFRSRMFIRLLNRQRERWERVGETQESLYAKKMELLDFSTFSRGILGMVLQSGYLLTFVWGLWKLQGGEISFGTMTAFLQLVSRVQGPFVSILALVPQIIRSMASMERVVAVLRIPQELSAEQVHLPEIAGLKLSEIEFGYGGNTVIRDFSAEFVMGVPSAVMGASGRGKSTLLRIMMGLHRPFSGKVELASGPLMLPMSEHLCSNIAFVPQGDKLLSGTVRYNLVGMRGDVTDQEIFEALRVACAEFVHELPSGLDTVVGEGGFGLSEGQAQRVGVARALLQDCGVWLMDEVTSALDPATAECLVRNLLEAGKDRVLIFVTHDEGLAQLCKKRFFI
jgi:ATP-binding cassette subfamily B protein